MIRLEYILISMHVTYRQLFFSLSFLMIVIGKKIFFYGAKAKESVFYE
jgi:hypothetical protein